MSVVINASCHRADWSKQKDRAIMPLRGTEGSGNLRHRTKATYRNSNISSIVYQKYPLFKPWISKFTVKTGPKNPKKDQRTATDGATYYQFNRQERLQLYKRQTQYTAIKVVQTQYTVHGKHSHSAQRTVHRKKRFTQTDNGSATQRITNAAKMFFLVFWSSFNCKLWNLRLK